MKQPDKKDIYILEVYDGVEEILSLSLVFDSEIKCQHARTIIVEFDNLYGTDDYISTTGDYIEDLKLYLQANNIECDYNIHYTPVPVRC